MTRKGKSKRPTPAELEILQALWQNGPATVREIRESLGANSSTGYTTTLKLLQIMLEKGLVIREESSRSHIYSAACRESEVQQSLTDDLLSRVFGGSASSLVLHALGGRNASASDIVEIRRLLDEMEQK